MREHGGWRARFLQLCGPGLLGGVILPTWLRLLREHGRNIEAGRAMRAASITAQSFKNTLWAAVERRRFDREVSRIKLEPPIFILGHWRSGTTHLHEILARDTRFGFPNSYQVSFPHTFLTTESFGIRMLAPFVPRCRPMDNMAMYLESPQEDEFALCVSTLKSPCVGLIFPRQRQEFDRFLTMQEVPESEQAQWKDVFIWFLKKVQLRRGPRPLILKSPQHTARIRLLLQLFPNAKFVHIHRDPYRVIQSTVHTLRVLNRWQGLQRLDNSELENWVVEQYTRMYRAFFQQKSLIPAQRFHELRFEDLEQRPLEEVRRLYEALGLPSFGVAEPGIRSYLASVEGYQKNRLPQMSGDLARRIDRECRDSFDRWEYRIRGEEMPSA